MMDTAPARLESFLAPYAPEIAATARTALSRLRERLPGCDVLVYDNYNALALGFSPDGKAGSAILSLALYPRWVSLFLLQGATLPDPDGLLRGKGAKVRHVVLASAADLDLPGLTRLISAAIAAAKERHDPARRGALVIKSVSPRQRPRRPG